MSHLQNLRRGGTAWLFAAVALAFVAVACETTDEPAADAPAAEAPAAEAPAAQTAPSYDPAALADPSRSDDDRFRDGGFKPLEVYSFLGVQPGMVVGDLMTAGMYNAHILSHLVRPDGRVLAIVSVGEAARERSLQSTRQAFEQRNASGTLDNVEIVPATGEIPDGTVDLLLTVRNYHDLGEKEGRLAALPELMRIIKPGGILGVIDAHTDKPDERDESVHRINADLARQEITSAGFEFIGSSDILMNPDDTFDFDGREGQRTEDDSDDAPIHRYYISRFLLKFRKPAS